MPREEVLSEMTRPARHQALGIRGPTNTHQPARPPASGTASSAAAPACSTATAASVGNTCTSRSLTPAADGDPARRARPAPSPSSGGRSPDAPPQSPRRAGHDRQPQCLSQSRFPPVPMPACGICTPGLHPAHHPRVHARRQTARFLQTVMPECAYGRALGRSGSGPPRCPAGWTPTSAAPAHCPADSRLPSGSALTTCLATTTSPHISSPHPPG